MFEKLYKIGIVHPLPPVSSANWAPFIFAIPVPWAHRHIPTSVTPCGSRLCSNKGFRHFAVSRHFSYSVPPPAVFKVVRCRPVGHVFAPTKDCVFKLTAFKRQSCSARRPKAGQGLVNKQAKKTIPSGENVFPM